MHAAQRPVDHRRRNTGSRRAAEMQVMHQDPTHQRTQKNSEYLCAEFAIKKSSGLDIGNGPIGPRLRRFPTTFNAATAGLVPDMRCSVPLVLLRHWPDAELDDLMNEWNCHQFASQAIVLQVFEVPL